MRNRPALLVAVVTLVMVTATILTGPLYEGQVENTARVVHQAPHYAQPALEQVIDGCAVRIYSTGPEIYETPSHICTGVISVEWNLAGNLHITQTEGFVAVSHIGVTEDETLSKHVACGPTGGIVETVIVCFDQTTGAWRQPPYGPNSNFFFEWIRWR